MIRTHGSFSGANLNGHGTIRLIKTHFGDKIVKLVQETSCEKVEGIIGCCHSGYFTDYFDLEDIPAYLLASCDGSEVADGDSFGDKYWGYFSQYFWLHVAQGYTCHQAFNLIIILEEIPQTPTPQTPEVYYPPNYYTFFN
ncbi:MAG: hypothetical protein ACFE9Z_16020 [Promethearchaeota archaeon]